MLQNTINSNKTNRFRFDVFENGSTLRSIHTSYRETRPQLRKGSPLLPSSSSLVCNFSVNVIHDASHLFLVNPIPSYACTIITSSAAATILANFCDD